MTSLWQTQLQLYVPRRSLLVAFDAQCRSEFAGGPGRDISEAKLTVTLQYRWANSSAHFSSFSSPSPELNAPSSPSTHSRRSKVWPRMPYRQLGFSFMSPSLSVSLWQSMSGSSTVSAVVSSTPLWHWEWCCSVRCHHWKVCCWWQPS